MSFAAVTAIVALHSTHWARRLLQRRDEGIVARIGRALLGMVATGLAVEIALMPLALFHFHRAGLYGVGANIIAIPLTTFVIMPLEAGALLLDVVGWGKPLWLLCGAAIDGLLRPCPRGFVGERRGRAAAVDAGLGVRIDGRRRPLAVPVDYAACGCSGLSRSRSARSPRRCAPAPDLLITGDGMHLAVVDRGTPLHAARPRGRLCPQPDRRSSGFDGDPDDPRLAAVQRLFARCLRRLVAQGRGEWRLLATRSRTRSTGQTSREPAPPPTSSFRIAGCRAAARRNGSSSTACARPTGGVAIYLGSGRASTPSPSASAPPVGGVRRSGRRSTPQARSPTDR